jgi:hypothetical protein
MDNSKITVHQRMSNRSAYISIDGLIRVCSVNQLRQRRANRAVQVRMGTQIPNLLLPGAHDHLQ